jgi:hypothetical protein
VRWSPLELGIAYGFWLVGPLFVMELAVVQMQRASSPVRSTSGTFPSAPLYARAQPTLTGLCQPLDRRLDGRS